MSKAKCPNCAVDIDLEILTDEQILIFLNAFFCEADDRCLDMDVLDTHYENSRDFSPPIPNPAVIKVQQTLNTSIKDNEAKLARMNSVLQEKDRDNMELQWTINDMQREG